MVIIKRSVLFLAVFFCSLPFAARQAFACGHDGFYLGLGYNQSFLYTPEHQLSVAGASGERIHFGPAFGGHVLFGYDVCGTRWGVQFPLEYAYLRLNRDENVHLIGSGVEAILHLAAWEGGLDIHMLGGGGWKYVSEGNVADQSSNFGVVATLGPGLSWYFARDRRVTGALSFDLPLSAIFFVGNRLSANKTTVFDIPLRAGFSVGF